jgi:hypothetical protein
MCHNKKDFVYNCVCMFFINFLKKIILTMISNAMNFVSKVISKHAFTRLLPISFSLLCVLFVFIKQYEL